MVEVSCGSPARVSVESSKLHLVLSSPPIHISDPRECSVVQRQMWLMNEAKAKAKDMTAAKAYDQARQEFYAIRHEEDVERRVAKEEALATGAYFGKGYLEIGMEQEDKVYEQWKEWAFGEAANQQRGMDSVWTGSGSDEVAVDPDVTETEGGTE